MQLAGDQKMLDQIMSFAKGGANVTNVIDNIDALYGGPNTAANDKDQISYYEVADETTNANILAQYRNNLSGADWSSIGVKSNGDIIFLNSDGKVVLEVGGKIYQYRGGNGAGTKVVAAATKPQVIDPKLENLVDSIYKGVTNPNRVGDSTLGDAVR